MFLCSFDSIYRGQQRSMNVDRSFFFFFFITDYSVINNLIRLKERFNDDLDETGSTVIHVIANVVIIFGVYFYT